MLGEALTNRMISIAGSGNNIEPYGKSAVVGLDGEIEHATALIHTLRFGNNYRTAVGATSGAYDKLGNKLLTAAVLRARRKKRRHNGPTSNFF